VIEGCVSRINFKKSLKAEQDGGRKVWQIIPEKERSTGGSEKEGKNRDEFVLLFARHLIAFRLLRLGWVKRRRTRGCSAAPTLFGR
jgi:hypothetical protein